MNFLTPPLYVTYLVKHYLKNLFSVLFGLSFAFAAIDYFTNVQDLDITSSYKILYIYYMWQEALGLLYPLSIVFALIMTKLAFVRHNTMGALHAFGYDKKRLLWPILSVAALMYGMFLYLHTTEFSYAKDKAELLRENQMGANDVNDLFFKYNDTFVYISKLDPINKVIEDITIFKVEGHQVRYTINAPYAVFEEKEWDAQDATLKTHIYKDGVLQRYETEHRYSIKTLKGYKPKIMESLYEGKSLSTVDAYNTWRLLKKQKLNADKVKASFYSKVIVPLFSLAMLLILFFKLPFHSRMMNSGGIIALSLGATFFIWGLLFGLGQVGANGVISPESATVYPIIILWVYALYVYFTDEHSLA
jgi:lipopolysaccharide export system permease protein